MKTLINAAGVSKLYKSGCHMDITGQHIWLELVNVVQFAEYWELPRQTFMELIPALDLPKSGGIPYRDGRLAVIVSMTWGTDPNSALHVAPWSLGDFMVPDTTDIIDLKKHYVLTEQGDAFRNRAAMIIRRELFNGVQNESQN